MSEAPDFPLQVREKIAANVRAEISRQKVSLTEVAEHLGVHRNTVTTRLAGTSPFLAEEIVVLAAFLNIAPAALIGGPAAPTVPARGVGPGVLGPNHPRPLG